jgi:hypothetical protein
LVGSYGSMLRLCKDFPVYLDSTYTRLYRITSLPNTLHLTLTLELDWHSYWHSCWHLYVFFTIRDTSRSRFKCYFSDHHLQNNTYTHHFPSFYPIIFYFLLHYFIISYISLFWKYIVYYFIIFLLTNIQACWEQRSFWYG